MTVIDLFSFKHSKKALTFDMAVEHMWDAASFEERAKWFDTPRELKPEFRRLLEVAYEREHGA